MTLEQFTNNYTPNYGENVLLNLGKKFTHDQCTCTMTFLEKTCGPRKKREREISLQRIVDAWVSFDAVHKC